MTAPRFAHVLRSPYSAPHVGDRMMIALDPHQRGGYVIGVKRENGNVATEGFATASDLRELAAMCYAAAQAMTGDPAP